MLIKLLVLSLVLIWCVYGDTVLVEVFYIAASRHDTTAVTLG